MADRDPWAPVLEFWFGELSDGLAQPEIRQRWFEANPEFDNACRRFESLLDDARDGALDAWLVSPRGTLAYILLTDQLPRNIHRGAAQAYAWDELARDAAAEGIRQRQDRALGWDERSFFYMPFEHSEDLLDQHTAVGLFSALRDEAPGPLRETIGNSLRYAHQHRDVITRFGRFPHRNAVLGRASSEEEQAFVAAGDGFGQLA